MTPTPSPPEPTAPSITTTAGRRASLARQAERVCGRLADLRERSNRLSLLRIGVFAFGVLLVTGTAVFGSGRGALLAAVASAAAFSIAVRAHRRVESAAARHEVWLRLLRGQVARSARDWAEVPGSVASDLPADHPFARDLELTGPRSLHRLIDTCVAEEASRRLLDWLAATEPDPVAASDRQRLVRELAPRSRFRRKLAATARLAAGADDRWRAGLLREWLSCHGASGSLRPWLAPVSALAAVNAVLFALSWQGIAPPLWQVTIPVYVAAYWAAMRNARDAFGEALELRDSLRPLSTVFGLLESYDGHGTPELRSLCRPFRDATVRPSTQVRSVSRLLAAAGIRGNPFVWVIVNLVVPWDLYVAHHLDRLKARLAERVPLWLDTWSELEAASALADLAYLNPGYSFPDIRLACAHDDQAPLRASRLGHPLLEPEGSVRNDFAFDSLGQVVIVTGSNMAGKSTFVKAVGVNVRLALAGGPVDAASLALDPLRVFASIRIADSITDGISYFYAEVKRLRAVLDALNEADEAPLLYLIDEIFRGTNNRERLLGSRALIRAMAGRNGVGLIATHDLELVTLAEENPAVRNAHFRDDVHDGRMTFDYRLHDGPCPTTNALRIMRLEGLPAPDA